MNITVQTSGAADLQNRAQGQSAGLIADDELRVIKILQHRGRLVARALDEASSIKRLVQAGLIRAVERPGGEVILVLSGDGLRLAHRAH
jgi:hypothetical protein